MLVDQLAVLSNLIGVLDVIMMATDRVEQYDTCLRRGIRVDLLELQLGIAST